MNDNLAERIGGKNHQFTGRTKTGVENRKLVQVSWQHLQPNEWGKYPTIHSWIPLGYLNASELSVLIDILGRQL